MATKFNMTEFTAMQALVAHARGEEVAPDTLQDAIARIDHSIAVRAARAAKPRAKSKASVENENNARKLVDVAKAKGITKLSTKVLRDIAPMDLSTQKSVAILNAALNMGLVSKDAEKLDGCIAYAIK